MFSACDQGRRKSNVPNQGFKKTWKGARRRPCVPRTPSMGCQGPLHTDETGLLCSLRCCEANKRLEPSLYASPSPPPCTKAIHGLMKPGSGAVPLWVLNTEKKHKPQGEGFAGTPALPPKYLLFEALMEKLTYPCCELLNITKL